MVSFISIAFVVIKLKIPKFCVPIQHPGNSPFWEVFAPLLSQYGPILPKFSPEVVLLQTKTLFENILKDSSIYGKNPDPKAALGSTLTSPFLLKMVVRIEKNKQ